jgi:hypothetical protein
MHLLCIHFGLSFALSDTAAIVTAFSRIDQLLWM